MSSEVTLAVVTGILGRYTKPALLASADPDELYLQTLAIESADMVTIIIELEDAFGFEIADEEIANLLTLGDIVRAIQPRQSGRAP